MSRGEGARHTRHNRHPTALCATRNATRTRVLRNVHGHDARLGQLLVPVRRQPNLGERALFGLGVGGGGRVWVSQNPNPPQVRGRRSGGRREGGSRAGGAHTRGTTHTGGRCMGGAPDGGGLGGGRGRAGAHHPQQFGCVQTQGVADVMFVCVWPLVLHTRGRPDSVTTITRTSSTLLKNILAACRGVCHQAGRDLENKNKKSCAVSKRGAAQHVCCVWACCRRERRKAVLLFGVRV